MALCNIIGIRPSLHFTTRRVTEDDPAGVNKMGNVRLASEKQKNLINILVKRNGFEIEKPLENLSTIEASRLIERLLFQQKNGVNQNDLKNDKNIDNIKLGLATKLVYNNWMYNVCALVRDKKMKEIFVKEVLETYNILQEISQRAMQMTATGDIRA